MKSAPRHAASDPRKNDQAPKAKTAHDKTALERQIAATDRQIDRLVYELYGLTEAEISIVEETVGCMSVSEMHA